MTQLQAEALLRSCSLCVMLRLPNSWTSANGHERWPQEAVMTVVWHRGLLARTALPIDLALGLAAAAAVVVVAIEWKVRLVVQAALSRPSPSWTRWWVATWEGTGTTMHGIAWGTCACLWIVLDDGREESRGGRRLDLPYRSLSWCLWSLMRYRTLHKVFTIHTPQFKAYVHQFNHFCVFSLCACISKGRQQAAWRNWIWVAIIRALHYHYLFLRAVLPSRWKCIAVEQVCIAYFSCFCFCIFAYMLNPSTKHLQLLILSTALFLFDFADLLLIFTFRSPTGTRRFRQSSWCFMDSPFNQ